LSELKVFLLKEGPLFQSMTIPQILVFLVLVCCAESGNINLGSESVSCSETQCVATYSLDVTLYFTNDYIQLFSDDGKDLKTYNFNHMILLNTLRVHDQYDFVDFAYLNTTRVLQEDRFHSPRLSCTAPAKSYRSGWENYFVDAIDPNGGYCLAYWYPPNSNTPQRNPIATGTYIMWVCVNYVPINKEFMFAIKLNQIMRQELVFMQDSKTYTVSQGQEVILPDAASVTLRNLPNYDTLQLALWKVVISRTTGSTYVVLGADVQESEQTCDPKKVGFWHADPAQNCQCASRTSFDSDRVNAWTQENKADPLSPDIKSPVTRLRDVVHNTRVFVFANYNVQKHKPLPIITATIIKFTSAAHPTNLTLVYNVRSPFTCETALLSGIPRQICFNGLDICVYPLDADMTSFQRDKCELVSGSLVVHEPNAIGNVSGIAYKTVILDATTTRLYEPIDYGDVDNFTFTDSPLPMTAQVRITGSKSYSKPYILNCTSQITQDSPWVSKKDELGIKASLTQTKNENDKCTCLFNDNNGYSVNITLTKKLQTFYTSSGALSAVIVCGNHIQSVNFSRPIDISHDTGGIMFPNATGDYKPSCGLLCWLEKKLLQLKDWFLSHLNWKVALVIICVVVIIIAIFCTPCLKVLGCPIEFACECCKGCSFCCLHLCFKSADSLTDELI
jgi:hypothetical protein